MAKKITTHTDRYGYDQTAVRDDGQFSEKDARAAAEGAALLEGRRREREQKLSQFAELAQARAEEFKEAGYVSAVSVEDPFDPRDTRGIADWHRLSFLVAEGKRGSSYDLMPDDYTPGGRKGRSVAGNRRTHRMKYEVGGATLRMPSVTACKRFSKEVDGRTFDIPVEADTPKGRFFGHVRITKGANGTWEVEPPEGMEGDEKRMLYTAEAVRATLEGRRPQFSDLRKRNLLTERAERLAQIGQAVRDIEADSSFIEGAGYNPYSRSLIVGLASKKAPGGIAYYGYDLTEKKDGTAATEAESRYAADQIIKGKDASRAFTFAVKQRYHSVTAHYCSKCGRHYTPEQHVCPVEETRRRRGQGFGRAVAMGVGMGWKNGLKAAGLTPKN